MTHTYYLIEVKQWYQSRTIWVNIVALLALLIQIQTKFIVNSTEQMAIIIVINLILRSITGSGLEIMGHNMVKQKIHNVNSKILPVDHSNVSDENTK